MINFESILQFFVTYDALLIFLTTVVLATVFNFYLHHYLPLFFRLLSTWLFAYIFSLVFIHIYSSWLRNKVESYAHFGGFIFSREPDAPKLPPEFTIYSSALNQDTWRNMYFLTGVIIAIMIVIIVEFLASISIRRKFGFFK